VVPPVFLLQGMLAPDPGPGGLPSALTYNLPSVVPSLVAGDVVLLEPVGAVVLSDIIRFNPAGTGSPNYPASLVFYSDNLDGSDSLADTRFPLLNYANSLTLTEVGPEVGPNGFMSYTPTAGQPGFLPGLSATYNITSDVPEPASLVMMGIGLAAVVGLAWRRRRTA
jgi:PEP-CTERM motif